MSPFAIVVLVILVALTFDFINGFHDAANSVATVVATRVLTPLQAVVWAAFFNFVSAFTFGTGVAKTVGSGFVDLGLVTQGVIVAGLAGAWWLAPVVAASTLAGQFLGHAAHQRSGAGQCGVQAGD